MTDDRQKAILIKETGMIYPNIDVAADELISRPYVLLRMIKSGNPYRTVDGQKIHLEFTTRMPNYRKPLNGKVRVIESGRVYESITEASQQTGIIENAIRRLIVSGREGRTVYGQRIHLELLTD